LPVEPALPVGAYMASDASLKITVNLSSPLTADHATVSQPSTQV